MPSNSLLARHAAVAFLGSALLTGCGLLRTAAEAPGRLAGSVIPGKGPAKPSFEQLLGDLQSYSDLIVFRVNEASHQFEQAVGTPEAELAASKMRLDALRWTTQFATGPNSVTGLLDLLVLATTMRWIQEDDGIPKLWGEAARPLWIALKATEQDGWILLERHLPAAQITEVRALLDSWRAEHPQLARENLLEFPSFRLIADEKADTRSSSSLLGFVGLDPLSGLETGARQIELGRQFAQRALYFAQRAPQLIGAEVEFRTLRARQSQEVRQLLADTERITTTLEGVAATAASLPEALSREREAALKQVGAELTAQRAGLLQDVEQARAPLESLLRETQATLVAGRGLSAELTGTLQAFDTMMERFETPAGEAETPAPAAPSEPEVPTKPFDIVEYGDAAERIGHAVGELHALVSELDQRLPEAQRLLDEAAARGQATVDHAMLRLIEVGLALIAAAGVTAWLVRRSARSATRAG